MEVCDRTVAQTDAFSRGIGPEIDEGDRLVQLTELVEAVVAQTIDIRHDHVDLARLGRHGFDVAGLVEQARESGPH